MRVELAPKTFAIIRENEIDGVEFIEKGKLSLKGEMAAIDDIYGDRVPAHYVIRRQDEGWKRLIMPFDLTEEGNFISVCLRDANRDCIIYPTIKEMLNAYVAKYPSERLTDADEIFIFSDEPSYEYPEEELIDYENVNCH